MSVAATPEDLEERIGYRFSDRSILHAALTHTSAGDSSQPRRYERLEFLGDAVVGLVMSDLLVSRYREEDEGRLSKFRSALVNAGSFAAQARAIGLNRYLVLGKGEEKGGGREKTSILADAYEALMGAIFVDGGYQATRAVLERQFAAAIELVSGLEGTDPKTELQERYQATDRLTPVYRVIESTGPDHARVFSVEVIVGEQVLARGEGTSKRAAEQDAARRALARSSEP